MNARKYLPLLLLVILPFSGCSRDGGWPGRSSQPPACVPVYAPSMAYAPPAGMYAAPQPVYGASPSARDFSTVPQSGGMRSLGTVSEGDGIIFKITPDGPAQRVEWWSPQPSGANGQICFESNGRTILCNDVKAGAREGVVYAFGDINFAGAEAAFRSAP